MLARSNQHKTGGLRLNYRLLGRSGLRVSELVGLQVGDLDLDEGLVRVRGKGKRERLCPIGKVATDWLSRWLAARQAPQSRVL